MAQDPPRAAAIETFTGPGENPHWNSVGPYLTEPQKVPLILLTDRPVQLETPRHYFRAAFTPNETLIRTYSAAWLGHHFSSERV
jgi:hypothetical protein